MPSPSTKETSLHHFRDPLVDVLANDPNIDFQGIIVVGTPQDNKMKTLVGKRVAVWIEAMRSDGVILSMDGWGNSDIDFANIMNQVGSRNITIVGLKFKGQVAEFIVTNDYTDWVLDINKSASGQETEVVGENNINRQDAHKILKLLQLKMGIDKQK